MYKQLKKFILFIFPFKFLRICVYIYRTYFDGAAVKSYSQEGEDMILKRLFQQQKTGFYIDIGAHHPKRFSNTYYFYKQGWHGINIDAMPNSMNAFHKIRPRDINIEKPISDKKEWLTYYAFDEPALNGFSQQISTKRDESNKNSYHILFTKKMETFQLREILQEHLSEDQEITFMSIDVEGLDLSVLKSNDFTKYKPLVIVIEILGVSFNDIEYNEITIFLKQQNYFIFSKTIQNVFYMHNLFYQKFKALESD